MQGTADGSSSNPTSPGDFSTPTPDSVQLRISGPLQAADLVAVARSILVIAWHLINDPDARYQDLGADWHQRHLNTARKTRDLVRQLQALGHQVALTPTA